MTMWAIIPARPLEEGKSRLAAVLTLAERKRLNDRFFRQTLQTAAAVVGKSRTLAVSRSDSLLEIARSMGCPTLLEQAPHGLNEALTQAARVLRDLGAANWVTLSCDLPFLIPDELRALIATAQGGDGLAIASDRSGSGTNALAMTADRPIPYLYGVDSLAAHRAAAAATGRNIPETRLAGLMFDVDTPDDLEQMEAILREHWRAEPRLAIAGCTLSRI